MGEYEELNDLVLDGSKKLRDYKTQPDEVLVQMNRPRPLTQSSERSSSNRYRSRNLANFLNKYLIGRRLPSTKLREVCG